MARLVPWNKLRAAKTLSRYSSWRSAVLPKTTLLTTYQLRAPVPRQPQAQKVIRTNPGLRKLHTSSPSMATVPTELQQVLTPALLRNVRNFWFDHLNGDTALILPGQSDMQRWFTRDDSFDDACVTQFKPALEAIIASGATANEILNVVDTSNPLNWLSILLLLDQVPRNCYRGNESKLVFGLFDPLAEEIAVRAVEATIPTQSSGVRYRLAYRFWFNLPLMHSENLAVHEQAIKQYEQTTREMEDFLDKDVAVLNEDERKCHEVLSSQQDALRGFLSSTFDFEKRHKVIIEQFGRYPHRNQALGRVSTPEEIEYLENGGETFG
ncbi:Tetratricopeptide-like helical [Penicillium hispanicum]|uniref:Tetratricopeptide-like helical n=1 Tax=Penicillium hispanicum TaxID=1080232 RepID=UPI0025422A0C|nr:Tetratricopeptide-like helical [Penicillium hispanicum]KAJ5579956.1 Tetratricopeptide-like helical [Penicillium hispanicum]